MLLWTGFSAIMQRKIPSYQLIGVISCISVIFCLLYLGFIYQTHVSEYWILVLVEVNALPCFLRLDDAKLPDSKSTANVAFHWCSHWLLRSALIVVPCHQIIPILQKTKPGILPIPPTLPLPPSCLICHVLISWCIWLSLFLIVVFLSSSPLIDFWCLCIKLIDTYWLELRERDVTQCQGLRSFFQHIQKFYHQMMTFEITSFSDDDISNNVGTKGRFFILCHLENDVILWKVGPNFPCYLLHFVHSWEWQMPWRSFGVQSMSSNLVFHAQIKSTPTLLHDLNRTIASSHL